MINWDVQVSIISSDALLWFISNPREENYTKHPYLKHMHAVIIIAVYEYFHHLNVLI